MRLTSLKLWHWMLIGTLLGAAIGYAWRDYTPPYTTVGPDQLRDFVRRPSQLDPTRTLANNVRVYPPRDGAYGKVFVVTFDELRQNPADNQLVYVAGKGVHAEVPFDRRSDNRQNTVVDFLTQVRREQIEAQAAGGRLVPIEFHDLTQLGGTHTIWIGAGGGFVLVGVLWPMAIAAMLRLGLVPQPAVVRREKKAKPPRRRTTPSYAAGSPGTSDGTAEVEQLAEHYRKKLDDAGGEVATTAQRPATPGVRKLEAGPLEKPPEPQKAPEHRAFSGEWYPVARGRIEDRDQPKDG